MTDTTTDEEEQITLAVLSARLEELQNEVQLTNDNLEQEKQSNAANYEILQKGIREMDEAKAEMQSDIADLQQQLRNQASTTTSASSLRATQPSDRTLSYANRIITSLFHERNTTSHADGLPSDTFTLMMTSPSIVSKAWLFAIITIALQMILAIMIASDQMKESIMSSLFNVPFKVDNTVRVGQFFTIIFTLATRHDITDSLRFIIMFWNDPHWDRTLLQRDQSAPQPTTAEWLVHVIVPNAIKFLQDILVMVITFIVIVQSDDIIDLLKDFTALMVLSETDNIFFGLAANGYVGSELQRNAEEAKGIRIQSEEASSSGISSSNSNSNRNINQAASSSHSASVSQKDFLLRPIILVVIGVLMASFWLWIVINQVSGRYFRQRYPKCNFTGAFEDAIDHFGDGVCYGGRLNTLECAFEGGDCINFNLAFPLCKGDDRTDVQNRVGNGKCDKAFMSSDCDYDGGDCCPYEIINDPLFGDGQCNGGIYSTESCGYDNKDCDEFILRYPNCPLDDLSGILGADDVVIGNGICDGEIYNLEDCGYEYGDCNRGQVGQTVVITDDIEITAHLWFSKSISMDGSTIALGMPNTDEDGNFDFFARGLVRIWRFDNIKKQWLQLGSDIVGPRADDDFGQSMSLTSNGLRIAISSDYGVRVYDFNTTLVDKWSQVVQTILSTHRYPNAVITSDGSRVALIHSRNEIRVYELQSDSNGNNDYHSINPGVSLSSRIEMNFNALDGSTLLLNEASNAVKIFQFKSDADSKPSWIQKGNVLGNPRISSTYDPTSTAISGDGNRIAIAFNSTHDDVPGQVYVIDFDAEKDEWIFVSALTKSSSSSDGDGFGYEVNMSSDGNLLVIASNTPKCQYYYRNRFDTDHCTTGSIEVYNYRPQSNRFNKVLSNSASPHKANGNMSDVGIFGFHFSMNGDGSVLSISGYNVDDRITFIEAYNLDELFYTKCVVHQPQWVGNGWCQDVPPYNSEQCGFDGGDCDRKPVEGYPQCFVYDPSEIGSGDCHERLPYNSKECGFDGGDCDRKPVDGYPNCFVHYTNWINNGRCNDYPPYNTEECGFDGGDCL